MVDISSHTKSLQAISEMVALVQTDIGQRGIKAIFPPSNPSPFRDAALTLLKAQSVGILTGFSCLVDYKPHIETDGIAGALAIAKSLAIMGRHVTILMDDHCEDIMKDVVESYFNEISPELNSRVKLECFTSGKDKLTDEEKKKLALLSKECQALVSIERSSVNPTGNYMTMRAIDIINLTSEFDQYLFPQVGKSSKFNVNQTLISIGDGGNEVGMGSVIDLVKQHIPNGEKICANTYCDHLLVSDTSNFGGYALVNAMQIEAFSIYKKDKSAFQQLFPQTFHPLIESFENDEAVKDFLHTQIGVLVTQEKLCADLLIKHQVRDGISKQIADTVDNISFEAQVDLINEMQKRVEAYNGE